MIRKLGTHLLIDLTRCKVIPLSLMTSQVRQMYAYISLKPSEHRCSLAFLCVILKV